MPFFRDLAFDHGHYARLMIALAVIAYDDPMSGIPAQVEPLGVQVVWGPADIGDGLGVSYTRAFITADSAAQEYTLVIRGTNPLSLLSWTLEDFDVGTTVPFNTLAPNAPAGAAISQGTYNGLAYLVELRDPDTRQSIVQYLQQMKPRKLYVTGHSLGGTLTPAMFAYLNEMLYGGTRTDSMALFSFAGLSPGNAAFNTYLTGLVDPTHQWRFHNTLDIAPYMWVSLDSLQSVYQPYSLSWGWPESDWLTRKFSEAAPNGYAQPAGGWALQGQFDSTSNAADRRWTAQAAHQHHGCTYQALVNLAFPLTPAQKADSVQTAMRFRRTREPCAQPARR
jgi:pimeloyl-ACP methyl ester carboxylesterase